MPTILVNFAALEEAGQKLKTLNDNLMRLTSDLEAAMRPIYATWDGATKEEYNVRNKEWDGATAELADAVALFSVTVQRVKEQYQATEAANVASVS